MTRRARLWAVAAATVAALVALSGPPAAAEETLDLRGDRIEIFGEDVRIAAGERLDGSIVAVGGDVVVEGVVERDVVVVLGSLTVRGRVDGNATAVLADVSLDGAEIGGDLVHVLGGYEEAGVRLGGQSFKLGHGAPFDGAWRFLLWVRVFHKLAVFLLVVAIVAVAPARVRALADEAPIRYLAAVFTGLLAYVAFFAVLGLLLFTVVGAAAAWAAFVVLKWVGVAGIFFAVGRALLRSFGRTEVSVLGGTLLAFALWAAIAVAPGLFGMAGLVVSLILRPMFFLLVEAPAIGLVVLTGVGSARRGLRRAAVAAAREPGPPLPPPPPGPR